MAVATGTTPVWTDKDQSLGSNSTMNSTLPADPVALEVNPSVDAARWWPAVGVITLLALVLRVVAIDAHSVWYDEAVTARFATASFSDLFSGMVRDNGNPPFYWLTIAAWVQLFGNSEAALRGLSVLCGVLSVPLLACLGRRLLGPLVGLVAALLFAVSPAAIEMANEARVYALLGLLVVLNQWCFIRWLTTQRRGDLAGYMLTLALCFYSHYYAFGLPVIALLTLLAFPGRSRAQLLTWLGATAVALLLFAPWLPVFAQQLGTPGNLARGGDGWRVQFLATPTVFSLGRSFAWRDSSLVWKGTAVALSLLAFVVPAGYGLYWLRRQPWQAVWLAAWCVGPILGPLAVALLFSPIYATRYALLALPAFLLLVGLGLQAFRPRWRAAFLTVVLAATTVSLVRYVSLPLKDDWRAAAPVIQARTGPHTPVIFDSDIEVTPYLYYLRKLDVQPGPMIGLVGERSPEQMLTGVLFLQGKKVHAAPLDCGEVVLSRDELWLALCVPRRPADFYWQYFEQHGYELAESRSFHRIELLRFARPAAVTSRSSAAALAPR
jgi:mannosyltransferase